MITNILSAAVIMGIISYGSTTAYAQIIQKDDPQSISLIGNVTTLDDVDLSIDFTDGVLPPNGTQSMSTESITDIDIQSLPPAGMSVILDNDSATVTLHPVEITPDTSSDDNGGSGSSDNEEDN